MESNNVTQLQERLEGLLKNKFADAFISAETSYDFPVFVLNKSVLYDVLSFLKSDADTGFTFLTTLCGLHFPDNNDQEFGIMYQLHKLETNERIRVKFFMSKNDLKVPTISTLWPTANWMERQEYDFFGFNFVGHPDLRRILNMDEMNYFPMRKEYPLEDGSRDDKSDKMFGR
jgi:NADH-quinone oxidoreductase subunit C